MSARVDDVSVYRPQPSPGTSDGPSVDAAPGTADGPSSDTTDGASDVTQSPSDSDAPGQKSPKRRKSEKTGRSGDDGGSGNASGAAAAAAAIITGVAIAVSQQQKKKQLAACEENLRSLRGRSLDDAVRVLDPAEYEVKELRAAPANGAVAEGAVLDGEVRRIRDDKCVVTLVYAESPPSPAAPDVPIPEVVPVPESVPGPPEIRQPPATPAVVAARLREPAEPPVPPHCRTPIEVASFVGGMRADAASWAGLYDLQLVETKVPSSRPEGEVLRQQPDAPAQLRCGAALALTVSDGTLVVVPAVTTLTVERARALIEGVNLVADANDADSDRSPGEVLDQAPVAGSEVPRGSTVRMAIATGLVVPDVTGLGFVAALQRLQAFQVVPTVIESELDEDIVAGQSPVGGSRAAAGSRVTLDVSAGPWLPTWVPWLVLAALLALAAAAVRHLLPRLVHARARLDTDGSVRTDGQVVAEGPSLRVDAHLERGGSRVLFPGQAA